MNARLLFDELGLRLLELDEERAREAQESWQRHIEACRDLREYEVWLESDGLTDLE